jgi:hypothetical protein
LQKKNFSSREDAQKALLAELEEADDEMVLVLRSKQSYSRQEMLARVDVLVGALAFSLSQHAVSGQLTMASQWSSLTAVQLDCRSHKTCCSNHCQQIDIYALLQVHLISSTPQP